MLHLNENPKLEDIELTDEEINAEIEKAWTEVQAKLHPKLS